MVSLADGKKEGKKTSHRCHDEDFASDKQVLGLDFHKGLEKALFDIGHKSSVCTDRDSFLMFCTERLGKALDVSSVYVFENDPQDKAASIVAEWAQDDGQKMSKKLKEMRFEKFPASYGMLLENKVIYAKDAEKDFQGELGNLADKPGITSILIVPVFVQDKLSGFIGLNACGKQREFGQADLFMLRSAAFIIGMHHARSLSMMITKDLESEFFTTKNFLQNVIDSAQDAICSTGLEGNITVWNKGAEKLTGYKAAEVMGKRIFDIGLLIEEKELGVSLADMDNRKVISMLKKGGGSAHVDAVYRTKSGEKRLVSVHMSDIKNLDGEIIGLVHIGRDITRIKEIHNRMADGTSYLLRGQAPEDGLNLFLGEISAGRKGLCVSRNNLPNIIRAEGRRLPEMIFLDGKEGEDMAGLLEKILDFIGSNVSSIIFIERVDYLIGRFGFSEFLRMVYTINSLVMAQKAILLISIRPELLEARQLLYLEEELHSLSIEPEPSKLFTAELLDILKFLQLAEKQGKMLSVKDIAQKFSITRPTTNDRIGKLLDLGLIKTQKSGRNRIIRLTGEAKKTVLRS